MLKDVHVCVYTFEQCEPQDMVFKLEFRETPIEVDSEYMGMLKDFGWEYLTSCNNFRYFVKKAEEDERNNELFTDTESKLNMLRKIQLRRLLPLTVIFLCCVVPYTVRTFVDTNRPMDAFSIFWYVMFTLYVLLILRVLTGFVRLQKKYSQE